MTLKKKKVPHAKIAKISNQADELSPTSKFTEINRNRLVHVN